MITPVKSGLLLLALILLNHPLFAQRNIRSGNDSTRYTISLNKTIIAGRHKLYLLTNDTPSLLYDFTVPSDTNLFIRDVDFVDDQKGYVIIGSRYIGNETWLYKTTDGGNTFVPDTSYFSEAIQKSLNQMQIVSNNHFLLFDGYYHSAVLRSVDAGNTWDRWIEDFMAHYFQVHVCANGKWYLNGLEGDGFPSYAMPIPDSLFALSRQNPFHNCFTEGGGDCVVLAYNLPYVQGDVLGYFTDTLQQLCGNSTTLKDTEPPYAQIKIWPNPGNDVMMLESPVLTALVVYNTLGLIVHQSTIQARYHQVKCQSWPDGVYNIHIQNKTFKWVKK